MYVCKYTVHIHLYTSTYITKNIHRQPYLHACIHTYVYHTHTPGRSWANTQLAHESDVCVCVCGGGSGQVLCPRFYSEPWD